MLNCPKLDFIFNIAKSRFLTKEIKIGIYAQINWLTENNLSH